MSNFFETEETRQYLVHYIQETEDILGDVLQSYDKTSSCKIYPSLDLGFPHELIRIAGGFPTGSLVTWNCNIPFVPVDTTVNVCSSSTFKLSDDIGEHLDDVFFKDTMRKLEGTSYKLNFHRGNHFVIYARSLFTGDYYLLLHSSAPEFKKTFNGLYPIEGNWYMDDLKIFEKGNRRIRYLVGRKAEIFTQIAHHVEYYNTIRHNFFAETIIDKLCKIIDASHNHHYYMPSDQSVVIGSFVADLGETLPIYTYPGDPIFMFNITRADKMKIRLVDSDKYLVPHGWGKTSSVKPEVSINLTTNTYTLNGVSFNIDTQASLRSHPDLKLRRFSTDESQEDYYFKLIKDYYQGVVVDKLAQVVSYNKLGVVNWESKK